MVILQRCKDPLEREFYIRNEYTFDFLALDDEYGEREREKALIARVEDFLRAMGGMFAFVGSQFRLEVGGKEYFIDLLLFHRRLRCLSPDDRPSRRRRARSLSDQSPRTGR